MKCLLFWRKLSDSLAEAYLFQLGLAMYLPSVTPKQYFAFLMSCTFTAARTVTTRHTDKSLRTDLRPRTLAVHS